MGKGELGWGVTHNWPREQSYPRLGETSQALKAPIKIQKSCLKIKINGNSPTHLLHLKKWISVIRKLLG